MARKPKLTVAILRRQAARFAERESGRSDRALYAVTDGKAVGTFVEHRFRRFLQNGFSFSESNSAKGIDFPSINVDMKVTSKKQPQSSCPYQSARQKIYGLGYSLLIFVYEKRDIQRSRTGVLEFKHVLFVEKAFTADYQTTTQLCQLLTNKANTDDLIAFMHDRNLPVDDVQAAQLADEIIRTPPQIGYLTISNALQWRLQYSRVIEQAGTVRGIVRIR